MAALKPAITQRLQGQLQSWRRNVSAQMPTQNPNYDPRKALLRMKP